MVRIEDLTSSVSLRTEKGDVLYRANRQPLEAVRIESLSGNVYCELGEHLRTKLPSQNWRAFLDNHIGEQVK